MRSAAADEARARIRERLRAMSPSDRAELALKLGEEAAASYAATHGVSLELARRKLRANAAKRRARTRPPRRPPAES